MNLNIPTSLNALPPSLWYRTQRKITPFSLFQYSSVLSWIERNMCDSTTDTYTLLIIYYLHHYIKKGKIHRLYCLSSEHWVPFFIGLLQYCIKQRLSQFFSLLQTKKNAGIEMKEWKKCFERKNSVTDYIQFIIVCYDGFLNYYCLKICLLLAQFKKYLLSFKKRQHWWVHFISHKNTTTSL